MGRTCQTQRGSLMSKESLEVLQKLVNRTFLMPGQDKRFGPGQLVLSRPQKERDELSKLKSSDLQNLRPDSIGLGQKKRKGRWS